MQDIHEIKQDVKEIKADVKDMTVKLAEYNMLLDIHIKGVQNLDARMVPVEDHVKFMHTMWKISVGVAGFVIGILSIVKLFINKSIE